MNEIDWRTLAAVAGIAATHIVGAVHVIHALINVRSSQGAIAWILALVVIPYVAIPFYWITGRTRFEGYVSARRDDEGELRRQADDMRQSLQKFRIEPENAFGRAAEFLGGLPFTKGNKLEPLINGKETFPAIFEAIASAKHYILINFYIVKNDTVGLRFKNALIDRAKEGVAIYFLYDSFGSNALHKSYLSELEEHGIQCYAFGSNKKWFSRLQINFRNHRKIVVIDGSVALIGGLNIGDEYLGRDPKFGEWRDTHLLLKGPAVQAIQLVFLEDWNWATGQIVKLHWSSVSQPENQDCAIIPTGPSDEADSWQLIVAEAANSAREKLWITSPYFVPDGGVLTALQTAAIRGVDVRILIPEKPDHLIVWLAAFTYQRDILPFGINLFKYHKGFLHQKAIVIDDKLACIGTANLDNRSFRLNFEISAFSSDESFVTEVTRMLQHDFNFAHQIKHNEIEDRSFLFRIAARAARLMSPIL